eukprot:5334236-Pleurochrysis_carterae.AAC.4
MHVSSSAVTSLSLERKAMAVTPEKRPGTLQARSVLWVATALASVWHAEYGRIVCASHTRKMLMAAEESSEAVAMAMSPLLDATHVTSLPDFRSTVHSKQFLLIDEMWTRWSAAAETSSAPC